MTCSGRWTRWVLCAGDKETVKAKHRPIVIITSMRKRTSDAFLRRCIFHYIEFPEFAQIERIVHAHFGISMRNS